MDNTERRVALVTDAAHYVGPHLARLLASRGHDLVLGDPGPDLVTELEATGATVVAVEGVLDLTDPSSSERLVGAAQERFGRLDAAVGGSGRVIVGKFVDSTADQLDAVVQGCLVAPYHLLRAVVLAMVEQGHGQMLLITSASAVRPTPGAPLYSAARAGATMLAKNVAMEVARTGVQVNVVGTNFMDFPEFLRANRVTDEASRRKVESMVPMKRLGTMEEFAAVLPAVHRRNEWVHHRPVRGLRRRLGLTETVKHARPLRRQRSDRADREVGHPHRPGRARCSPPR